MKVNKQETTPILKSPAPRLRKPILSFHSSKIVLVTENGFLQFWTKFSRF
jgi:hypothetical protein